MKKWLFIFGTVFVVSVLTGWVVNVHATNFSPLDDVDDVYYWPESNQIIFSQPNSVTIKKSSTSDQKTSTSEPDNHRQYIDNTRDPEPTITYIEDSDTQRSDTIVKAVIRR